jgi:hypothetical protein
MAQPENKEDDFDSLLKDIISDGSKISELTEEQVIELRKKISPYGRTVKGEKDLCCMSIVNVSQEYMKKWVMTSVIGFLFRGCDEYRVFDNEPVINLDDIDESGRNQVLRALYKDAIPAKTELAKILKEDRTIKEGEIKAYHEENKEQIALEEAEDKLYAAAKKVVSLGASGASGAETDDKKEERVPWQVRAIDKNAAALREQQMQTLERIILRAENMTKRIIIREFLDSMFTFNPDVHVRGAYGFNPLDPERKEIKTDVAKKSNASWQSKDKFDKHKESKLNKSNSTAADVNAHAAEDGVSATKGDEFDGDETDVRKVVTRHIPPADTYFKLQMYMDDFHDQLKSAVTDIYHEKADIEWAVNPYQVFSGETKNEDAKKFVHKHADEVLYDIETLHTNHWNLMGSFKKNKDRTDFLNSNTEVITEYLSQLEKDKKMGRGLMMKKAQRKKLANVGKDGPDSKMFKRYKSEFATTAEAMGAVDLSEYKQQKQVYEDYQKKQAEERARLANATRGPNGAIIANTTNLAVRSGIDVEKKREFEYPNAGLSEECPDEAIQVDVINMMEGGLNVQKSNFFSDAEAPESGVTAATKQN